MKRLINILATVLTLSLTASAQQSASGILSECATRLKRAKSIEATFVLTSSAAAGETKGSIVMSGQRFRISSPQLTTWYNGTTQWTLNTADKEVTINNPTSQELQTINPFLIINKFSSDYTPAKLKSSSGTYAIRLTAKNKNAEIRQAVILIDAKTYLPQNVTATDISGRSFTIKLSVIKAGRNISDSEFVFQKAKYPTVEVIDLRD